MVLADLQAAVRDYQSAMTVELLDACDSTNDVAREWHSEGSAAAPSRPQQGGWLLLVAAEQQTAGRGRMGRSWQSPPGAGLLFSVALGVPDDVDAAVLGVMPLATGVAIVGVCREVGVSMAGLKWPNDLVLGGSDIGGLPPKLGGILAERAADRVIVGVGLNVDLSPDEAPTPQAVSLRSHGLIDIGREELLARLAAGIADVWEQLLTRGAAEVLARYTEVCTTLGRQVVVALPGDRCVTGVAEAVDAFGHLLVRDGDGVRHTIAAGDVSFVRPPQP
jgi:BirA family biotin operon repressor/biotin-[acetyl-CoA-carboxylase] ligase